MCGGSLSMGNARVLKKIINMPLFGRRLPCVPPARLLMRVVFRRLPGRRASPVGRHSSVLPLRPTGKSGRPPRHITCFKQTDRRPSRSAQNPSKAVKSELITTFFPIYLEFQWLYAGINLPIAQKQAATARTHGHAMQGSTNNHPKEESH